jgi:hypothetical protein
MNHMQATTQQSISPLPEPGDYASMAVTLKVRSYKNGTCSNSSVVFYKYPDGTVVLDDGKNHIVQRPLHHPVRQIAQPAKGNQSSQPTALKPLRMLLSSLKFITNAVHSY